MSYSPYPGYVPYAPAAVPAQTAAAEEVMEPLETSTRSPGYTVAVWIFAVIFVIVIVVVLVLLNLYKNNSNSFPLSAPRSIRAATGGFVGLGQELVPNLGPLMRLGVTATEASGSWELEPLQTTEPLPEGTFYTRIIPLYGAGGKRPFMQVSNTDLAAEWPPVGGSTPDNAPLALPNPGAFIAFSSILSNIESLNVWEFVNTGSVTALGTPYQIRLRDYPSYYLDTIPLSSIYGERFPDYNLLYVTEAAPKTWFLV